MRRRSLVLVEPRGGRLSAGQAGTVAAARRVSDVVEVLLPVSTSEPWEDLVLQLGRQGADVVHVAAGLAPSAAPRVTLVADLHVRAPFSLIAMENSSLAPDVAGALAVRLAAGVCWDLLRLDEVEGQLVGHRLALADSTAVEVEWTSDLAVALFRVGSAAPEDQPSRGTPEVRQLAPPAGLGAGTTVVASGVAPGGTASGLETASVVVAGGRGLGGAENVALLEELAVALGGVVGVSMPVVDMGWYPYEHQVGQTGKTVRPRLYVACGISGAVQHRVGMSGSGTVVAINSDPQAPVFGICDLGVVGDLRQVVPRLTALLLETASD